MRVALFPSSFHPHLGGVETMCRALAGQLRATGHAVTVLTNRWPRQLPEHEVVEGVPVQRLAMRVAGASAKSKVTAALTGGLVRRHMLASLAAFRPDVVHVHCVSVNADYAVAVKKRMGIPLIVTLHGELTMDASHLFQQQDWAKRTLAQTLKAADAMTACSGQTLAEAEAWYGQPFGRRARVVHNGIWLAESERAASAPFQHPRPYILALGRHVRQKGFDLLLRAFSVLVEARQDSHDLILAGDGEEHAALQQLAAALNISGHVTFTGRVDHAQACQLFAGCTLFVLPSRHEPFGIVNLEAMAAGKAVVATNVGGVSEVVIAGETGLLVKADDVPELAGAIGGLLSDPAQRQRLGAAGLTRAQLFGWPAITEKYVAVYQDVLTPDSARDVE